MLSDSKSMMVLELRKLHHIEDDKDVRNLIFDRLHINSSISDGELQVEVTKEFGERYPGMSQNDWRHIIEAYTPLVRDASKPQTNNSTLQYRTAADPLTRS